jgi:hypothetical protein
MFTEEFITEILPTQLKEINDYIMRRRDIKVAEKEIHRVSRKVVLFYISMIKRTKGTDYYKRYTHTMVRLVETAFMKQIPVSTRWYSTVFLFIKILKWRIRCWRLSKMDGSPGSTN